MFAAINFTSNVSLIQNWLSNDEDAAKNNQKRLQAEGLD